MGPMVQIESTGAEARADGERIVVSRERNFVGDLGLSTVLLTRERALASAPLADGVRNAAGAAALSLLVTMVDVAGSDPALANCRPDWTATQDLAVHAGGWITDGPVVGDHRLVRLGKRVVVVGADLYDGHGVDDLAEVQAELDGGTGPHGTGRLTFAGRALLTFVRLPSSAPDPQHADDYDPAHWIGEVRERASGLPVEGTMRSRAGLRLVDVPAGVVEVAHAPYVANSIGTINGAVQALAVEAAAEAVRPELVATDVQIHYLSQVRTGPARTRASVVRDAADHSVVTVELLDAGADDRLGARATVTLQRPPG